MPFVFQITAILISGTLYCRTLKTLKNVRSVHRSSLITKIFIALWLLWVITSVPYKSFVALESLRIVKSSDNAIDTSFYGVMSIMNLNDVFGPYDFVPIYNEDKFNLVKLRRQWYVEIGLRTWKISYGFINSLLLIILLKPFNQPIVKLFKKLPLIRQNK